MSDNLLTDFGGNGGTSETGNATGGNGGFFGDGGNATSGNAGDANGGSVLNEGGNIINVGSNQGGNGGVSKSGNAVGGNGGSGSFPRHLTSPFGNFGNGGSAQSGNAGNANGGSVTNKGSGHGIIFNNGSSTCSLPLVGLQRTNRLFL